MQGRVGVGCERGERGRLLKGHVRGGIILYMPGETLAIAYEKNLDSSRHTHA